MRPILFKSDEKVFDSYGLGEIDATKATVTRERNGNYTLYLEYPAGQVMASQFKPDMRIKADAGVRTKNQTFIISRIVKDSSSLIKVYAKHISHLTEHMGLVDGVKVDGTARDALYLWSKAVLGGQKFDVWSDIDTIGKTSWTVDKVKSARDALGGVEGSILDIWGGEYQFDNTTIRLHKQLGRKAPTVLEYGRNILSAEDDEDIESSYTSIYPYATYTPEVEGGGSSESVTVTLPEKVVDSDWLGLYADRRVLAVDLSSKFGEKETPTADKLRNHAKAYVKANRIGLPKTNTKVEYVDLAKTLDYTDMAVMEEVELCDIVPIYYPSIGLTNDEGKVVVVNYDVLNDRNESIEIGMIGQSMRSAMAGTVADRLDALESKQAVLDSSIPAYLLSADGNKVWYSEPDNSKEHKVGDTWFEKNGEYNRIYIWNGEMWEKVMDSEVGIALLNDGIEQAKAKAEEKAQKVRDGIHSEFREFETEWNKSNQERDQRIESALTTAGASSELAKSAKEISDKTKADLDKLKTSAEEAQQGLDNQIRQIKNELVGWDESAQALTDYISAHAEELGKHELRFLEAEQALQTAKSTADKALAGLDGKVSTADFVQNQKEWTAKFSSVQVGGRNLLPNSDFKKTGAVTAFTVGGKTYNTGLVGWATYNGGIPNPETSYHAYVGEYGGRKQVGIYNESNGLRNWKAFNLDLKNDFPQTTNEFIFSADVYASGPGTKLFGGFYYYDKSGNRNFHAGQFRKDITVVEKWNRVSVAVPFNLEKCDFSKGIRFYIYGFGFTSNSILAIDKIKLETGTLATDWSPAPEDTAGLITAVQSEFKIRADGLDSQVKSLQEKDKTTETTVTRLTQGLGEVTLGVERLTRNLESGLTDKVTSAQLKVELDGIRTKVAETDAKTAKIAEVETTVNGVKESLSKLNQGRRNLLKQSRTLALNENKRWNTAETYNGFTIARSTGGNQYTDTVQLRTSEPPKGTEYVLTFYARASKDNYPIRTHFYSPNTTLSVETSTGYKASKNPDGYANLTITREWKRYWVKYSQTEADEVKRVFIGRHGPVINGGDSTTTVEICSPALFEGNMIGDWSPAPEDGEAEITAAKAEFTRTADGLTQKLTAVESYVAKDGERSEALKSYVRKETASQIEAERSAVARDYVAKSNLTETVNNINRRFEQVANQTDTKIAEYDKGVDGRFANITSQLNGKVSQTDFQKVQETSKLYERIIGSTEKDVTDKIARMVMTNQLFQVEISKNKDLKTVQNQIAGAWGVNNKDSLGQIVAGLNLLGKNAGIKAETIRLEGTTLADKLSAYEGRFNKLFVADGTFSKLNAEIFAANSITADKLRVTSALAEKMVADKAFLNTLLAKTVIASYVQAVDLTANQIEGGILKSLNGSMYFDLDKNHLVMTHDDAAIRRESAGYPTQFIRYENQASGRVARTIIGSNRDGSDKFNSVSFSGVVIENNSLDKPDAVKIYGDVTQFRHSASSEGWDINAVTQNIAPATWEKQSQIWAKHFTVPRRVNKDSEIPTEFMRLEESVAALWNIWAHGVGQITMTQAMKNLITNRKNAWGIERNVG